MDDFVRAAHRELEAQRVAERRGFTQHAIVYSAVILVFIVLWLVGGAGHPWFLYPALGWGVGIAGHAAATFLPKDPDRIMLERDRRRALKAR